MRIIAGSGASLDGTVKFSVATSGGVPVEAVYLPFEDGTFGICVSTQAGCNMGCAFCTTGQRKSRHNLTATEIRRQVALVIAAVQTSRRFAFITLSGMGEPFDNYGHTITALQGLARDYPTVTLSVSTVGLVDRIRQLVADDIHARLYVSLHSLDEGVRHSLVPVTRAFSVEDVLKTSFEYAHSRPMGQLQFSYPKSGSWERPTGPLGV